MIFSTSSISFNRSAGHARNVTKASTRALSSSSSSSWASKQRLKINRHLTGRLRRRMLDRGADQTPPYFEPRLHRRIPLLLQRRIAEQDRVERAQDFDPVRVGPGNRILVLEVAVLGVGPSTASRTVRLREARSPLGPMLLPVKRWIAPAAVRIASLKPRRRSV